MSSLESASVAADGGFFFFDERRRIFFLCLGVESSDEEVSSSDMRQEAGAVAGEGLTLLLSSSAGESLGVVRRGVGGGLLDSSLLDVLSFFGFASLASSTQ